MVVLALAGLVAVGSGAVALAADKGRALHVLAGRVFHHAVLGLAVVVVPTTMWTGDVFLALLTAMSAYLVHSGRREVQRHRVGGTRSGADTAGVAALGLVAVALAGAAAASWQRDGASAGAVILGAFGVLVGYLAGSEWRRLARPPSTDHAWLTHHVGAMGVALATVATAWTTVFAPTASLPPWLPWLGPLAVVMPIVLRWIAVVRADGQDGTFL